MRYEKQILESYARIGYQARDNQVEHINQVIVAFLDEGYKNVILSAPTGTGKSIIGAVVSDVIQTIRYPDEHAGASFILSATNALLDQYAESFIDETSPDDNFNVIKGANNYVCSALSTADEPQTAEHCAIRLFQKSGMDDVIQTHCNNCEFQHARSMKPKTRHLITNYAYYFVDRMYSQAPMPKRAVCVFDEVHLLNDLFTEHNAIYFSEKRIKQMAEEVSAELSLGNSDVFKNLKMIRDDMMAGKINEKNQETYLRTLLATYNKISDTAKVEAERNVRNQSKYLKLNKLAKKYFNLGCKIDDLFTFEYPSVFEYKEKDPKKGQNEHEISVKPIFIGEMFEALDNADHNLLMSATISELYAKRTMSLPGTTKHIRLSPQFPPENKKVIFFKPQSLNYTSMKDPATIKKLCATAYQIVDHHTKLGDRGIILCPSFNVVESISASLRLMNGGYKVFEHCRGEKLADWLEAFKSYTGGPAVLLTPSGFEGVDLPGDLSRYQIVVKMPFASLGDKRIKVILDTYPDIYGLMALQKVVQGAGRSVRSKEDHAVTYILDTAAQRAFMAKDNEWKDEFSVSFSSQLSE
jgi:ATP-dependent DNA helicase DinG